MNPSWHEKSAEGVLLTSPLSSLCIRRMEELHQIPWSMIVAKRSTPLLVDSIAITVLMHLQFRVFAQVN